VFSQVHTRNSILDMERKIASVKIRTDTLDLEVWNRRTKKKTVFVYIFFFQAVKRDLEALKQENLQLLAAKQGQ
jgi:SMC interacting uncharacterized protein involved in chromosome segregation